MFAAQDLAHLNEDHVDLIKRLMHGSKDPQQAYPTAPWLFDVVSAKPNSNSMWHLRWRSLTNIKATGISAAARRNGAGRRWTRQPSNQWLRVSVRRWRTSATA